MKQRYFLHLKCQSPEDPRNTHMSCGITSLLLSSTVTGCGERAGQQGGDTEDEDLQSPQSRRKIAAVNANAENPTQGPDPYLCEQKCREPLRACLPTKDFQGRSSEKEATAQNLHGWEREEV